MVFLWRLCDHEHWVVLADADAHPKVVCTAQKVVNADNRVARKTLTAVLLAHAKPRLEVVQLNGGKVASDFAFKVLAHVGSCENVHLFTVLMLRP